LLRRLFSANPVNGIFPDKSDFIIVNFWATWCPPCKKEIPDFVESVKKYENLLVIGISYDKSVSDVVEFIEKEKINYPVYMSSDIIKNGEWEPEGLPQSFLFYKGKFVGSIVGMMDAEEISLFVSKNFSFLER
jgi:cytochrome c-type biogenesis protein